MNNFYTNVFQKGSYLYVRGIENGRRFSQKVDFQPTFWVKGNLNKSADKWSTIDGQTVYSINPGSISDCRAFVEQYKEVEGFPVYESPGHVYQYIAEKYTGEIQFDPKDILIYTIDIETEVENGFPNVETANEKILLITIKNKQNNQIVTWGTIEATSHKDNVEYRKFTSEQNLLKDFIIWWQQNYPDVITGWNSNLFDITYLYNRMCKVLGETLATKLSPFNNIYQREVDLGGRTSQKTNIAGIALLDYLDLYKKFTYSVKESYKLDAIAFEELGERKLENPGNSFKEFYELHSQIFFDYNVRDVELVDKLDDKLKLLDLAFTIAYAAKINYEDVFSPVKTWDVIIYNYLNDQKIVIPQHRRQSKESNFEGAYVKDPLVGKHHWCCSLDLNSLYPHLIMQYNMSPETITSLKLDISVNKLLNKECDLQEAYDLDYAVAANGWCFNKSKKGLIPIQMQRFYDFRVIYKKQMLEAKQKYADTKDEKWLKEISSLNNKQMAVKILLNSCFGALGTPYFRYFDIRIAEGITISGQLAIRWIADRLNNLFNKTLKTDDVDRVVLIDTDSVVLTLNDLINKVCPDKSTEDKIKYMDKVAEEIIQPFIDKGYQELADYTNAYEQKMVMKRENLIDVMISVSKKRYVMSVHNSEGVQYKEPQLKVMGLHMIKSSTPAVIRAKLKDSLTAILYASESDVQQYVANFKSEFNKFKPEEIAFPRGINDVAKYSSHSSIYSKGTPIHVRGALLYNHQLKKLGLEKKYQLIREGDKIKFLYLKMPNTIREDCIAFIDKLPEEFNLEKFIDYNKMFEKTFLDAIQNILDAMKWNAEQQATLEDWFM